jgi:hypothetical protein
MIFDIPEAQSGNWRVERFEMSADQAMLSAIRDRGRSCPAGTYFRLMRNSKCIMSNTPAEMADLYPLRRHATGSVLINGLGLGIAASLVLAKPDVTAITIVELSPDVISLVAPFIVDSRVTVIEGDAYSWSPPKGVRYNAVWHDIWDDLCADNLPLMSRLHRKYGHRADWQGSWGRAAIKYEQRRRGWW